MAFTLSLGFNPIWSNFNIFGVSAGGAKLYSYDSLNPSVKKFIFSDPAALFPYSNPVLFDQNGNAPGPFYFLFDSLNPSSLYDLFLYDADGNLIWDVNSYFPSGGSGGSVITLAKNLNNLVTNSILWRNIGGIEDTVTEITISDTKIEIAPSAHDGLSFNILPTPAALTANYFGPDIQFLRSNNTAIEKVSFPKFPLGSTQFSSGNNVTPVQYLRHQVTTAGSTEAYRYYQFPITSKVQNLTNQIVTVSIWGLATAPQNITLSWGQFYGDGSAASATDITLFNTFAITSTWTKREITVTVPNVAGKVVGQCGNDGLFLLVGLPQTAVHLHSQ